MGSAGPLSSALDSLAQRGERHLRRWGVRKRERTREASLGVFDRQLHLDDRFVTADEFSRFDQPQGFEAAAVEDAAQFLERARQAQLRRIEVSKLARRRRWKWLCVAGAMVLLAAALWWFVRRDSGDAPHDIGATVSDVTGASGHQSSRKQSPDESRRSAEPRAARDPAEADTLHNAADDARDAGSRGDTSAQSSAGQPGAARPSDASQSSSGAPSGQASASEGKAKDGRNPPSAKSAAPAPNTAPGKAEDKSSQSGDLDGSTAAAEQNSGAQKADSAGAANRNDPPAAAQRQSSSQEQRPQAAGTSAAQSAQQSQSQSHSAAQSSSNPGASTGTSQGKGQGNGKDALKKSRGVPSMILGVPTPDRIQGLPNPGPVRTIQKKVAPKEQDADVAAAQSRGTRTAPVGTVAHPPLRTWMKDLIRDYFSPDEDK